MSQNRPYFVSSGLVGAPGSTAAAILYGATTTTQDLQIVAVRVAVESASGASPPSNGSVLFQLAVTSGTRGGGSAVTPRIIGQGSQAANTGWYSGSTALTGLTEGNVLWEFPLAFTGGAGWGEYFPTGFERYVPVSSAIAMWAAAAVGAGTDMNVKASLDFGE